MPACRPLALEAEGRSGRRRPRLPCRLLGSPRLERPLRERRLHGAASERAEEQWRALQLYAAGRRRRPRSHRLAVGCPLARGAPASDRRRHARPRGRSLRRHRRAGRERAEASGGLLGGDRAGPRQRGQGRRERRRHPAPRLRGARLRTGSRLVGARRRGREPALQAGDRCRRRAPAQRQPGRRRCGERAAGAGREDRLLGARSRRLGQARNAARSSTPISGLPANGSVGFLACTMSSSRVCTLASDFGWL